MGKVPDFEPDTVKSFLDYIYADLDRVPNQDLFKKKFDDKRLTSDLLRMSHLYEVTIIQEKCVEHLKKSIVDENVVDICFAAETTGSESLKKAALNHIGKKREKILDIPRMDEVYESPLLVKSLVTHLSGQMSRQNVISVDLEEIFADVTCTGLEDSQDVKKRLLFAVKPSDTFATLRTMVNSFLHASSGHHVKGSFDVFFRKGTSRLTQVTCDDQDTFTNIATDIGNGGLFDCQVFEIFCDVENI